MAHRNANFPSFEADRMRAELRKIVEQRLKTNLVRVYCLHGEFMSSFWAWCLLVDAPYLGFVLYLLGSLQHITGDLAGIVGTNERDTYCSGQIREETRQRCTTLHICLFFSSVLS